jgi:GAF domain-containing protein
MNREAALVQTFVDLADTLVDDFDIVDLLTALSDRCVEVLDVSTVGIMLVDANGELRAMASSSEVMRVVELFELQSKEGPCLDSHRSGQPIDELLAPATDRWPTFAPVALAAGFRAAAAIPMRLRDQIIGALNLFQTEARALSGDDSLVARALADIATIAILQHRKIAEADVLNDQLNHALTSRIIIEQAKGIVAERQQLDMPDAFDRLRAYARTNNRRLHDVAMEIVGGTLDIGHPAAPS